MREPDHAARERYEQCKSEGMGETRACEEAQKAYNQQIRTNQNEHEIAEHGYWG